MDRGFDYEFNARRINLNGGVDLMLWNFKLSSLEWASTYSNRSIDWHLIRVQLIGVTWTLWSWSNGLRWIRFKLKQTDHFRVQSREAITAAAVFEGVEDGGASVVCGVHEVDYGDILSEGKSMVWLGAPMVFRDGDGEEIVQVQRDEGNLMVADGRNRVIFSSMQGVSGSPRSSEPVEFWRRNSPSTEAAWGRGVVEVVLCDGKALCGIYTEGKASGATEGWVNGRVRFLQRHDH